MSWFANLMEKSVGATLQGRIFPHLCCSTILAVGGRIGEYMQFLKKLLKNIILKNRINYLSMGGSTLLVKNSGEYFSDEDVDLEIKLLHQQAKAK